MRPVKLRTVVKGYVPTKTDFLFERRLTDYVYSVIAEHSKSKPSLIFCRSESCSAHSPRELYDIAQRHATQMFQLPKLAG